MSRIRPGTLRSRAYA